MSKGRRKAAFLYAVALGVSLASLSGCAQIDSNKHPLLATLGAFLPHRSNVSGPAAKIKFASINFTLGHRSGLLILTEQQPGLTYWRSSRLETVVLSRGYLQSTQGLQNNLEMTHFDGLPHEPTNATPWPGDLGTPKHYQITRRWQIKGTSQTVTRTADATLVCHSGTEKVKLPLATLPLKRCVETLRWQPSGHKTKSTYWIDPKDNRIWAADTRPWPGSPRYDWQVARPWW